MSETKKVILNAGLSYKQFIFVSRGDSTLRGHNFLEPSVAVESIPFD